MNTYPRAEVASEVALEVPPQEEVTTMKEEEVISTNNAEAVTSTNNAEAVTSTNSAEVAIPKDLISKNNVAGVATSKNAEVDNLMRDEVATSTNSVGVVAILSIVDLPERGMSSLKDIEGTRVDIEEEENTVVPQAEGTEVASMAQHHIIEEKIRKKGQVAEEEIHLAVLK